VAAGCFCCRNDTYLGIAVGRAKEPDRVSFMVAGAADFSYTFSCLSPFTERGSARFKGLWGFKIFGANNGCKADLQGILV
jgi:hypothetical protein